VPLYSLREINSHIFPAASRFRSSSSLIHGLIAKGEVVRNAGLVPGFLEQLLYFAMHLGVAQRHECRVSRPKVPGYFALPDVVSKSFRDASAIPTDARFGDGEILVLERLALHCSVPFCVVDLWRGVGRNAN
jgi:hypothetical protein